MNAILVTVFLLAGMQDAVFTKAQKWNADYQAKQAYIVHWGGTEVRPKHTVSVQLGVKTPEYVHDLELAVDGRGILWRTEDVSAILVQDWNFGKANQCVAAVIEMVHPHYKPLPKRKPAPLGMSGFVSAFRFEIPPDPMPICWGEK